MDVNYADTPFEPDNPHPFETSLFVRTTVISTRDEFAVTDAGIKELQREEFPPRVASGAHPDSLYELVGDDMGRVTVPEGERMPQVGDALECIAPHCYQTLFSTTSITACAATRWSTSGRSTRAPSGRERPDRAAPFRFRRPATEGCADRAAPLRRRLDRALRGD